MSSLTTDNLTSKFEKKSNGFLAAVGSTEDYITSFATLTTSTPIISSLQLKKNTNNNNINNINTSTTRENDGEVLGTAAAYKLDIREPLIGCSLSEFACSNEKCIPSSKYCDRINDCDDNSDEPRFCTRKILCFTKKLLINFVFKIEKKNFVSKQLEINFFKKNYKLLGL